MKKLYTFALAAAVAVGATAATPKKIKEAQNELQQAETVALSVKKLPAKFAGIELPQKQAPAKAPAIADLEGTWTVSYKGLLNSNAGNHECEATLTWDTQYDQFEIEIADCTVAPFYAYYDATTGKLTFELEYFGSNSNGYIFGGPLSAQTGNFMESYNTTYDASTQSFSIPSPTGLGFGAFSSQNTLVPLGYYWAGYDFVFEKPDGDYKLTIEVDSEECVHELGEVDFTITKGADIASIKFLAMEGDWDAKSISLYFALLGQDINAGTYNIDLTPEELPETDDYFSLLIAGYDATGALRKTAQTGLYLVYNRDDQYQTIGKVNYNDKLVSSYYSNFTNVQDVEVQENKEVPGLYRLVNAYAGQSAIHDATVDHYIYIDATDPEFVNINTSATGLDFGDGMLVIGTFGGALGYSKEQCAQNNYIVGYADDRSIIFPTKSVLAHEQKYNDPGSWSYMNSQADAMEIVLPDIVLNVTVLDETADNAPLEGVTVETEGVSATTDAEGKVSLTLPASVDYLQSVEVTVTLDELTATKEVKLNGADNSYDFVTSALNGVSNVGIDGAASAVEYYNMQGVRVANPTAGQLLIKKQGTEVSRVLVK